MKTMMKKKHLPLNSRKNLLRNHQPASPVSSHITFYGIQQRLIETYPQFPFRNNSTAEDEDDDDDDFGLGDDGEYFDLQIFDILE